MENEKQGRQGQLKYDNRVRVSYPDQLYASARRWAMTRGLSIQDLQREAMQHYVSHLEKTGR